MQVPRLRGCTSRGNGKLAYEQAIGHATSNSTVYQLLARHGWRKLMPRPFHPKRDVAVQDVFKKMAFVALVRRARRAAARHGRRLRIMFVDEARFGRMNRPRACWAPPRLRPKVAAPLIREYIYLYGAVRTRTLFALRRATATARHRI
jgi:hypothetical protein